MKKLTLLLAVGALCAPHSYGMEAQEKHVSGNTAAHVVDALSGDARKGELTIAELEKTLAQLKLSQKENNIVRSWISKHKGITATIGTTTSLYAIALLLSYFGKDILVNKHGNVYTITPPAQRDGSPITHENGQRVTGLIKFQKFLFTYLQWPQIPVDWTKTQITDYTARTTVFIAAVILFACIALHEYSRGKDSTTAKTWNKLFGKKQKIIQAQKNVDAQLQNVAAPVAA
ncbi:MAG: hypothetical protein WCW33_04040 [Candidatus Babeliales bacterium]|jgi:hypothetical protein